MNEKLARAPSDPFSDGKRKPAGYIVLQTQNQVVLILLLEEKGGPAQQANGNLSAMFVLILLLKEKGGPH